MPHSWRVCSVIVSLKYHFGGFYSVFVLSFVLLTCCNNLPLQECTMKVQEGKFKLQDLLVVPMQRVLKYHLLLKVRPSPHHQKYFELICHCLRKIKEPVQLPFILVWSLKAAEQHLLWTPKPYKTFRSLYLIQLDPCGSPLCPATANRDHV